MLLTLFSITTTCLVCFGLFKLFMWHDKRRNLYKLASRLNGPPGWPILGNGHSLIGDGEHLLRKLTEWNRTHPSLYRIWIGPQLAVTVTDPDQIKKVYHSPKTLDKGEIVRQFVGSLFGAGLFSAPVSTWRVHRKLIQPTFNKKILDSFLEIFTTQAKIFVEQIERNVNGPEFDVLNSLSPCTLYMICESTMGVNIGVQTSRNCHYVEALLNVLDCYNKRILKFWQYSDFIFYRSKLGRTQQENLKYLNAFSQKIIESKKNELLKRDSSTHPATDENEVDACGSTPEIKSCLDYLLRMTGESRLSDREIRDEVNTLLAAGTDTIAITLSYAMLMLSLYPDIQDKVYEELYEIYGDADDDERPVESDDLMRMKYMECVIKETLRIFPPFPYSIRAVTEDFIIDGQTLPKGSYVLIAIHYLQRNEKYWPNPMRFDPNRFLPEKNAQRHPSAFMAFGAGPRNCIGINYAMTVMKVVLTTALRRYILKKDHIIPVKDIRLSMQIVLKPVESITLRIEKRTRN